MRSRSLEKVRTSPEAQKRLGRGSEKPTKAPEEAEALEKAQKGLKPRKGWEEVQKPRKTPEEARGPEKARKRPEA